MRWSGCNTTRRRLAARCRRSWPTVRPPSWSRSRAEPVLRKAILVYGVFAVIGAIALALAGVVAGLVFYLFVNGAVVLAAGFFSGGGHPPGGASRGPGAETPQRLADPANGQPLKGTCKPPNCARG